MPMYEKHQRVKKRSDSGMEDYGKLVTANSKIDFIAEKLGFKEAE